MTVEMERQLEPCHSPHNESVIVKSDPKPRAMRLSFRSSSYLESKLNFGKDSATHVDSNSSNAPITFTSADFTATAPSVNGNTKIIDMLDSPKCKLIIWYPFNAPWE
jgi:hypothetical protein